MSITLDDAFPDHPKVMPLSDAAFRLLVKIWCYAKRHRTGGVMRHGVILALCGKRTKSLIAELIENRLLEGGPDDTFVIHDWSDWWNEDIEQANQYKEDLNQRRRALSFKRSSAGRARAAKAYRDGDGRFQSSTSEGAGPANSQHPPAHAGPANSQHPPAPADSPPAHAGDLLEFAGANGASKPSTQPAPSRASAHACVSDPDPDPDPDPGSDLQVVAEGRIDLSGPAKPSEQQQQPRSLEDALRMPIQERAKVCVADAYLAQYLQPEEWPEVRKVATTLGDALGHRVVLAAYHRDPGVRAVVQLFAAGFTEDELERTARADDAWWKKEKRGLSSMSPEVVRRALSKSSEPPHPVNRAEAIQNQLFERAADAVSKARIR